MTVGSLLGAEHAGDREAVDVGVDDADRVAAGGEGDGEVRRHAGLADAALAGRDEQRPGPRAGLGERDRPALGVALRLAVGCGRGRLPCSWMRSASRSWSVITVNSTADGVTPSSAATASSTRLRDLVLQRAAGDGEGDEDGHAAVGGRVDRADHAEVDDRAVQLRVLDRPEGVDDLVSRDGHRVPSTGGHAFVRGGDPCGEFALRPIGRIPGWPGRPRSTSRRGDGRRAHGVHRGGLGDHRRLRRSDPPADLPVHPRPRRRRRRHRVGGRRRGRRAPQRRPPPPRQARRRRLRRGRQPHRRRRRAPRRAAVEALRRRGVQRARRRRARCAATTSCWRCSGGRSTACRAHEAEAMAEEVGATYGRAMAAGLTGDALAAGQRSLRSAMQAVADALTAHGFAAHMASAEPPAPARAADHQRPLPVRHRRQRPPGDLRRRPRDGARHAQRAVRRRRRRRRRHRPAARPAATRSARPPSEVDRSAGDGLRRRRRRGAPRGTRPADVIAARAVRLDRRSWRAPARCASAASSSSTSIVDAVATRRDRHDAATDADVEVAEQRRHRRRRTSGRPGPMSSVCNDTPSRSEELERRAAVERAEPDERLPSRACT